MVKLWNGGGAPRFGQTLEGGHPDLAKLWKEEALTFGQTLEWGVGALTFGQTLEGGHPDLAKLWNGGRVLRLGQMTYIL